MGCNEGNAGVHSGGRVYEACSVTAMSMLKNPYAHPKLASAKARALRSAELTGLRGAFELRADLL